MRNAGLLSALLLAFLIPWKPLQAQAKVEIFGGYSHTRVSILVVTILGTTVACVPPSCLLPSGSANVNLNGWEVSAVLKPGGWLGVAADFSGHYGSFGPTKVNLHNYLFGPQFSIPGRVSPFVHALIGQARRTEGSFTDTSLAIALGGGIDVEANRFVAVRLIQADYFMTRFDAQTQSRPRISAGLVLRF